MNQILLLMFHFTIVVKFKGQMTWDQLFDEINHYEMRLVSLDFVMEKTNKIKLKTLHVINTKLISFY